MEAFLISTFAVAVAEIGDKTQLLALILAARYKRPFPIIFGILAATLLNHALAGLLGEWIRTIIDPAMLRWILGASFLVIAVWALIPDKMEENGRTQGRYGVFFVTCIAFFIAEMGDKTQIATVALAAKYSSFMPVVTGTTIGMMIANVPAVILGKIASPNFPFKLVRTISAGIFAVLGVVVLLSGR